MLDKRANVTRFVVIPRKDFYKVTIYHLSEVEVDNCAIWLADDIG